MDFVTKLTRMIEKNNSLLCVGMDPSESMLPAGPDLYTRLLTWGTDLVAQTADLVCCYKPNMAFFEQFGPKGVRALADLLAALPADMPILLDAKRGDIGSTAEAYARGAYEHFKADAVTLSPYLGADAVKPFVRDPEKAVFILCQTSNPSAREIQSHGNPPLYLHVAQVSRGWGAKGQIGLVVGATQPEALAKVRGLCPDEWLLVPGVGAQGGDLRQALELGLRPDGLGMILPVSRSVLQAPDPRAAAVALRDEINAVRAQVAASAGQPTPIGRGDKPSNKDYTDLVDGLFETGCVQFGSFTLASGRQSPVYLDLRRLVSFPDMMDKAVEAYVDQLTGLTYDFIAGVPYAALPIASVAASRLKQPMIYPRKEAKEHGTARLVEGVFREGQTAVLVEDVITSGGSLLTSVQALASAGVVVRDAVVLVDREQGGVAAMAEQGLRVRAVLKFTDILTRLRQTGKIDEATYILVAEYLGKQA